ncbi:MAG: hypothetical protein IT342_03525 [Candidatus Melainabacteria bacterium]|nr:hypothetical protein [Candidatus Melainabacteria bacterium]
MAKNLSAKRPAFSAFLLAFFCASAAYADLKNEDIYKSPAQRPIRIKRGGDAPKTKPSGYHNEERSPSREARDEYYLLVAEEPKTDGERLVRKFEAAQLPKILSVLKGGNFNRAQQMLAELAGKMPVDSRSRSCYQRLSALCADRMDAEYWYRYDIKEIRHAKDARQSIADLPDVETTCAASSSRTVQSLRKEAWLLLTAGAR